MADLLELIVAELHANPEGARKLAAELAQIAPVTIGPEALLTVQQAAARAQVSEKTIRRRIDSGDLPAVRIGTRLRVDPEQLQGFLEASGSAESNTEAAYRRRRRGGSSIVADAFRRLQQS